MPSWASRGRPVHGMRTHETSSCPPVPLTLAKCNKEVKGAVFGVVIRAREKSGKGRELCPQGEGGRAALIDGGGAKRVQPLPLLPPHLCPTLTPAHSSVLSPPLLLCLFKSGPGTTRVRTVGWGQ